MKIKLLAAFFILSLFLSLLGSLNKVAADVTSVGTWVPDQEVTFAGKIAARASDSLNWVVKNYRWSYFQNPKDQSKVENPLNPIWKTIRNIIYTILTLFILAGAFLIIITRGESVSVRKFLPKFVVVVILVSLSFSLIQFLYQITDLIQGFFLRRPGGGATDFIQSSDLLNVAFPYKDFQGFRRIGPSDSPYGFDESAFISLLLVRLTAATYYVMFILLVIRKVILWFFIIVSPVFPLLILFYPLKNSAKIWVGEFFRWLLYGPLFAIFLFGLVVIWQRFIPINTPNLPCERSVLDDRLKDTLQYPTSVNILLGGPCQKLTPDQSQVQNLGAYNNLNNSDSFIQYVVALLMLWMVIIMPFILLKIFLDYINNVSLSDNGLMRYLYNKPTKEPPPSDLSRILPSLKPPPFSLKPPPMPVDFGSAGLARELPRSISAGVDVARMMDKLKPQLIASPIMRESIRDVLVKTNIKLPSMREIAQLDSAMNLRSAPLKVEASKAMENLSRIGGTSPIMTSQERQQFSLLMQHLQEEAKKGNPVAKNVVEATKKAEETTLPEENQVQQVNLDDYEEVKKTWMENYQKLEPPEGPGGQIQDRKAWIKQDIAQIQSVVEQLSNIDVVQQQKGKETVGKVLPFLLLGGFSRSEIIAYLKAKQEAAKASLEQIVKAEADEESKLYVDSKGEEKPKSMTLEAPIEEGKGEKNNLGEKPIDLYAEPDKPLESVKVMGEDKEESGG